MTLNRSFSRRIGKSLSDLQKNLLDSKLPQFLFSEEILIARSEEKPPILEIGIGMGEHFAHQAYKNPEKLFIGAEVYLNGIANVLKLSERSNISNFLLWPNDIDIILEKLPDNFLQGIYLLFPDPWPKRKKQKKRFFNEERFQILNKKLKKGGFFIFASDIDDYFESAKKICLASKNLKLMNSDFSQQHDNYIITKYHKKAQEEQRDAKFIYFVKY